MLIVICVCLALIAVTTLIHYEVLSVLNYRLGSLAIPKRTKLLVVIFATFFAHAVEIFVYGVAFYLLIRFMGDGGMLMKSSFNFNNCLYFSAETYTSLGYGDISPFGPIRLVVGVEALNGLLLVGWSVSFAYIAMERFWQPTSAQPQNGTSGNSNSVTKL